MTIRAPLFKFDLPHFNTLVRAGRYWEACEKTHYVVMVDGWRAVPQWVLYTVQLFGAARCSAMVRSAESSDRVRRAFSILHHACWASPRAGENAALEQYMDEIRKETRALSCVVDDVLRSCDLLPADPMLGGTVERLERELAAARREHAELVEQYRSSMREVGKILREGLGDEWAPRVEHFEREFCD